MKARLRTWAAVIPALVLSACAAHDHPHDGEASHNHPHGVEASHDHDGDAERPTIAVTRWTDRSELFMEYPALVAGETGRFAIHVTDLSDFTPPTSGEAVVVLRGSDGAEAGFRGGISRPGIFGVDVTPAAPGAFEMSLKVEAPGLDDVHALGPVTVHGPGAPFPPEEGGDEGISFLKEQQWTLEFGTEVVVPRTLQRSLTVPAVVKPRAGGEALLSAPVSGRIDPSSKVPIRGERVPAKRALARIVPRTDALRDAAGLRASLVEAQQRHELATRDRDRAARLVESRALPARRLEEAEAAVAATKAQLDAAVDRMARLEALSGATDERGGDAFAVRAPFEGVLADVRFAPGESVEEGDFLVRLVDTDRVHVAGSVPESQAAAVRSIGSGEIVIEGEPPIPLGRPVALGDVIDPQTRTIEVRYALDNTTHRLPIGRGIRIRIFLGEAATLPAVPESAIVDDGGSPVVFVQTGGESFQRRPVVLGNREGGYVHVLEGVTPEDRVVSRGAYLIRLAAMSTQIPAHGHVH